MDVKSLDLHMHFNWDYLINLSKSLLTCWKITWMGTKTVTYDEPRPPKEAGLTSVSLLALNDKHNRLLAHGSDVQRAWGHYSRAPTFSPLSPLVPLTPAFPRLPCRHVFQWSNTERRQRWNNLMLAALFIYPTHLQLAVCQIKLKNRHRYHLRPWCGRL